MNGSKARHPHVSPVALMHLYLIASGVMLSKRPDSTLMIMVHRLDKNEVRHPEERSVHLTARAMRVAILL